MSPVPLDPIMHAPNRLQICAFLAPLEEAEFQALREELEVSDSVLSKHLSRLEAAGYVRLRKGVADSRPRTWAALTAAGRATLERHIAALQQIVAHAER